MTAAFSPCTLITARISSPRMEMYRNFSSEVRRIAAAAGSAFLTDSLSFLLTLSALAKCEASGSTDKVLPEYIRFLYQTDGFYFVQGMEPIYMAHVI